MPGTLTNTEKNAMLGATGITHVQAYNGDPAGAGTPLGSRASVSWAAASGGSRAASNQPALSIGAGQTVTWLGFFDASTGGNLRGSEDVTDEAFGNAGTYTVTSVTLTI